MQPSTAGPANIPETRYGLRHRGFWAAVAILLCSLSFYFAVLSLFGLRMQEYFGLSKTQFGVLLGGNRIPAAIGAIIGGYLVDRLSALIVLRWSLAGVALGSALAAIAVTWQMMLAVVMVAGAFASAANVALAVLLVELFPDGRRRILSIQLVITALAMALLPLWCEVLLAIDRHLESVRFAHILHVPFVAVAIGLVVGVVLLGRCRGLDAHRKADVASGAGQPGARPLLALLLTMIVLHGACDNGAYDWMPRVLDSYSEQMLRSGFVMAAFGLAFALSRSVLSVLPEHVGRGAFLVLPGLLGGGMFLVGLLSQSQAGAAAGYVLGGGCWAFEYPVMVALLAAHAPGRFGRMLALANVMTGVVGLGLIAGMGWLGERLDESRLWTVQMIPAGGFVLIGLFGATCLLCFGHGLARLRTATSAGGSPAETGSKQDG